MGHLGHGLHIDPCDPLHRVLAPALSVGAMGHLGHLAIIFKSLAYNITTVYIYSIFDNFLIQLNNDPKDPKPYTFTAAAHVSNAPKHAPNE
jgi:hypothetical protein